MSRRMFWAQVGANIVAGLITIAGALVIYKVWRGRFPALEDVV